MDNFKDDKTRTKRAKKLGGNKAAIFVYATEGLENMAFISNAVSLVTYFSGYMNFGITKSANTLTNFVGTAFLLALFGGFISDTYLTRFKTCVLFGIIELLGYGLLAIQAHFHQLRPIPCKGVAPTLANQCEPADSSQTAILFTGLYLVALGTSGIKAALPSLGADQFNEKDPKEAAQLSSFFNWFLFSITIGAVVGVTFLVWISTNQGWEWSFGVSTIAVLFAIIIICMGKSLYRNNVPNGSPLVRILQVFVVAIKNRNVPIPERAEELHEIHDKEAGLQEEIIERTDQFRYLDRAAIIRSSTDAETSINIDRWSMCTVTQVEEAKILIRMLPIILSTVFMNTCLAQLQTFSIQQSQTMDTQVLGFKVPGPSLPVIPLLFMAIMIPIYDRIFVPFARKITGIPTGISQLQRIGVGLVLSAISMAVSGLVETKRKHVAIEHNMVDSAEPLPLSVFWLGIQYAIFGAADMFTLIGLLEFFYAESSAGMKALSTAISWCSIAFGYFLSSVTVEVVNKVTGGWLASNNLNRDKLNYFYYLLSVLSVANFGFYLVCASWYRYKKAEVKQIEDSVTSDVNGKMEMTRV
ncbi:Major facilitator superfamily protein [Tripterygium wilfordii]|uniref:Major facilitator superfamily protein n=1 Tax=Tripterygium wilfordii TaxID=458696 RepID=A0A7J7DLX0_TRIWF|nr:protein NRT1/ PTR FAMILY 4.5-like [Tripterygium wilfordii]XP_038704153.1 protein NRT1/ PTR FAMILY 4.5-like [Tripterygium wilfordii]KAF5747076.1 Major facilitator superfamily protein [Tripterygium wilfordii]